ncbi:TPA: hypothetical protein ACH3X2_013697 [Trebouxia sp. C0005]
MGLAERPANLAQRQAVAAVGQIHLMRYYQDFFAALGLTCAQVLLTLNNLSDRGPYLNARNTFQELLAYDTIPIVNENDTIAVEEIRFGDNDTLSSQVATLVRADWLFLLTDVDSLYTANPASHPEAVPIPEVHDITKLQVDTSGKDSQWGTGGMVTKLTAARIATAAGCTMVICSSNEPQAIPAIMKGKQAGTVFHPLPNAVRDRKRWILSVPVKGELWLDSGAVAAVRDHKKSLFAAGILKITGDFAAQDAVVLCDSSGYEFARGLCNYTQSEVHKVQGKSSRVFKDELGFVGSEEIIHRNNICLLSIVQNLDPDIIQDGVPSLSADDEPSPMKLSPTGYGSMPNQAGIPGLTDPAWSQHQQQGSNSGYCKEGYAPGSLPMQNQEGNFPGPVGGLSETGQYWQQPQHGSSHFPGQGQNQGQMIAGALHDSHQGNYPPSFPPGSQQGWQSNSGGNPVKQEPDAQPASFGFPPQRDPSMGSGPNTSSGHPAASLPYGGNFPPQDSHNHTKPPYQPSPGPLAPGGRLPPHSGAPGSAGTATNMLYQPPQHSFPTQAAGPPSSQGHGPAQSHRDSRGAPPPGGKGKSHTGPTHKKRQFESGPGRGVSNQRQSSYPPGGQPRQSRPVSSSAASVHDRMQHLQSRGRPQEQGTDAAPQGSTGMTGFMPSANPAWRDADFRTQQPPSYNSYGYANQQPDINEQGWLPR